MPVEIRPALEAEMQEYRRVALSSLVLPPQKASREAIHGIRPEMTLCAFVDGRLSTAYAAWPLMMRINGVLAPTAGITFVGTLPSYRQQGLLRKIITRHFERMHAQGEQPLAALVASQAAIYHRYGYAVVTTRNSYHVEPRNVRFIRAAKGIGPVGSLRTAGENENELLNRLYCTFSEERTGYLKRGKATWAGGVLRPPPENSELFKVLYEENGEALGYIIYSVEPVHVPDGRPWQKVFIRDLVWLGGRAYNALWDHMATFELADHVVWMRVPLDDPLPHLLLEPRRLNMSSADGVMARIVDVARALPLRGYAAQGVVTFELIDALCPWNNGRWQLETTTGGTEVKPTGRAAQVRLPVDTLAMLMFGQISASEAFRMGRMDVLDHRAVATWDALMRTKYKPFCPDFF
jgi:predicted acetyltransferase